MRKQIREKEKKRHQNERGELTRQNQKVKQDDWLGCNAVQSGTSPPMFRRNTLPPFSGSKLVKKPARNRRQAE
jgi:hypothetical protein